MWQPDMKTWPMQVQKTVAQRLPKLKPMLQAKDVAVRREALETLARLHINRIGALLKLPRADLPSRFGTEVLERLDQAFDIKTSYVPYNGTGDLALAVLGGHINGAMTYTPFAIANKGKVRALAVALRISAGVSGGVARRGPLVPDLLPCRDGAWSGPVLHGRARRLDHRR